MQAQGDGSECVRMAKHPGKRTAQRRAALPWNYDRGPLMDPGDSAQHVAGSDRVVVVRKRIATRDPAGIVLFDQAMDEEPVLPRHQNYVSGHNLLLSFRLDAENVTRPNRGEHAGAECSQPQGVAGGEKLGREFKPMTILGSGERSQRSYEFLRLKRH